MKLDKKRMFRILFWTGVVVLPLLTLVDELVKCGLSEFFVFGYLTVELMLLAVIFYLFGRHLTGKMHDRFELFGIDKVVAVGGEVTAYCFGILFIVAVVLSMCGHHFPVARFALTAIPAVLVVRNVYLYRKVRRAVARYGDSKQ